MKYTQLIICITIMLCNCSQQKADETSLPDFDSIAQAVVKNVKDSLQMVEIFDSVAAHLADENIFYKEINARNIHYAYLDTDDTSKYYALLKRFDSYEFYLDRIMKDVDRIRSKQKFVITDVDKQFPPKWLPLYKFKEDFCLYKPSEFGVHYRVMLKDGLMLFYSFMGPQPEIIISLKKENSNMYILKTLHENGIRETKITYLDKSNTIAKWENESYKMFMTPIEYAENFNIMANVSMYCKSGVEFVDFGKDTITFGVFEDYYILPRGF